MPTYTLELEFYGLYSVDIPQFLILSDGALDSSYAALSTGIFSSHTISYNGGLPASLEFRFDDGLPELNRAVHINQVVINDRHVNISNFLSTNNLLSGETATLDIANGAFLFGSDIPDTAIFTTNPTATFTADSNTWRDTNGTTDHVFDLLAGRDIIYLGSGADSVNGNLGDDIMYAGAGEDLFYGAEGSDRIYGQDDNDTLYGGAGNDRIDGGNGDDKIHGGDDNDTLLGKSGADIITGGNGNDKLNGGAGDDVLYGDDGDDQLIAGAGNNTLDGGAGDDVLYGGRDNDIINGGTGNDWLIGGKGDDVIYTDGGNDVAMGQAGDDVIYSGSSETLNSAVTSILNNNAGVSYNAETNSFYQFINTTAQWSTAQTAANSATLTGLTGVNGHLVTITSQTENDYITTLAGANTIWLGASDATIEGNWIWTDGAEAGQQFWLGTGAGNATNSMYSNWTVSQPSNASAASDYASFNGGNWVANSAGSNLRYVIEWDAESLISTINNTFINGGTGTDDLYANDGVDIFRFDNTDEIDDIFNFDVAGHDAIDIENLLSYDALSDDINDFVNFTETASDTVISVDVDGTDNGANFVDIARLNDTTGLDDIQLLIAGDNLIV